jgi:glutamate decarboxylase
VFRSIASRTSRWTPGAAYQVVHDHLMLDGNARVNLATFVTTWMEPEADRLMAECLDKNMIDKDEYPQTAELELRCINMLARLWNIPAAAPGNGSAALPRWAARPSGRARRR